MASHTPPMMFSRMLLIDEEFTWQVYAADHLVPMENEILNSYPEKLSPAMLPKLIQKLDEVNLCQGNYEPRFVKIARLRKCRFISRAGQIVAILDEKVCINVDGALYFSTVRHVKCSILISSSLVCDTCVKYRDTLRALFSRFKIRPTVLSMHTNVKCLRTPQRDVYIKTLQRSVITKNRQIKRLKDKLKKLVNSEACSEQDETFNSSIMKVVENHKMIEKDDFKRIFWEQQVHCTCVACRHKIVIPYTGCS